MNVETHIAVTWRSRFLLWSDGWPESGPMVTGRRRSSFRMLRAGMGLVDEAGADGRLHGRHDWWTVEHLAKRMHLSRKTAGEVLQWLEECGWLVTRSQPVNPEGTRQPNMRQLTIPQGQAPSLVLPMETMSKSKRDHGKESGVPGVNLSVTMGNGRIRPLPQSVDTSLQRNGEDEVAKATDNGLTDTSQSTSTYKRPVERWEGIKDKVVAR